MKIAMVGTGYVGLVTGTCLAESGNEVTCIDIDQRKIDRLSQGEVPIFEPGLAELIERNVTAGRLRFTTDYATAVGPAEVVFLAVGTPSRDDGSANLSYLFSAVEQLAPHLAPKAVVVVKSTVPVGTNAEVYRRLCELTGRDCHVASNPEFLKEGAAVGDFMYPDRVVVGVRCKEVGETLHRLYTPYLRTDKPFLAMSPESAEMTKYVANALLATKISFINEMANLCERLGADINAVRRGIGHDRRIGFAFLFPGVGYGGSCFPKDVRALEHLARQVGVEPRMLQAVDAVNERQKHVLSEKIIEYFGDTLRGRLIAVWGLAFKSKTDDIREAPALVMLDRLLAEGASICVHDPEAMDNVRTIYGDRLTYATTPFETVDGADALAINTEWDEFRSVDFAVLKRRMKAPVVFDGRNLYEPEVMADAGCHYISIGRQPVVGGSAEAAPQVLQPGTD